MIDITIHIQEINGYAEVSGQIGRQCVTPAEIEELRRYPLDDLQQDMQAVANAESRKWVEAAAVR